LLDPTNLLQWWLLGDVSEAIEVRSAARGPDRDGAAQEEAAFVALLRPHWDVMTRVAGRLAPPGERDDVLQNAAALAWRKRHDYDAARGAVRAWLLAITTDQARKSWRRDRPNVGVLDDGEHEPREGGSDAFENASDRGIDMRRQVDRLPDRQRTAVALYYYCDLPVNEVAAVMGCAEGTVKSTLADARGALRQTLGRDLL
jgi:RNA polymerase sigma-70 factor (ECF subfamily)